MGIGVCYNKGLKGYIMMTLEEVFEKVKSGEWTFEQFEAWVQDLASSRYDEGYKDARADADNDRRWE